MTNRCNFHISADTGKNGFEVDSYANPILALSHFTPNKYGLLLLDIRMPAMNGFELFKRMKSMDSQYTK
jgi:DNA-binding response OmpR family regulator